MQIAVAPSEILAENWTCVLLHVPLPALQVVWSQLRQEKIGWTSFNSLGIQVFLNRGEEPRVVGVVDQR